MNEYTEQMVLKRRYKTHSARQNNTPSTPCYSPSGICEKRRHARCFPDTRYLNSSNKLLNAPFVFRLGVSGFSLWWCTPAATTAATRESVNAPIKHFLNEGLQACLLLLHAWQECRNILTSPCSSTSDNIFHQILAPTPLISHRCHFISI